MPEEAQHVPFSTEAEQAVIGAVLLNPLAFPNVAAFLKGVDFFLVRHQYIWQAIEQVDLDPQQEVDYLTVTAALKRSGHLDKIGGPAYLTRLVQSTPTSVHAEIYGRLVQRASIRRQLLQAADEIRRLALDENVDLDQVVNRSSESLFTASRQKVQESYREFDETLSELYDDITGAERAGLPFGWDALEFVRLHKAEVTYCAGVEKSGKTTFGLNIAYNLVKAGGSVAYLSREIGDKDIARVMLSMETGIHPSRLRSGNDLTPYENKRMAEAMNRMAPWRDNLKVIDNFDRFSPLEIERILRIVLRETRIDLVIIDGFWLIEPDGEDRDKQFWEQQHAGSVKLKEQAKRFNLPYFVLHQLKSPGRRHDIRPIPSDLQGGKSVRNNCHRLMAIHRDSHPDFNLDPVYPDRVEIMVWYDRSNSRAQGRGAFLRFKEDFSRFNEWKD